MTHDLLFFKAGMVRACIVKKMILTLTIILTALSTVSCSNGGLPQQPSQATLAVASTVPEISKKENDVLTQKLNDFEDQCKIQINDLYGKIGSSTKEKFLNMFHSAVSSDCQQILMSNDPTPMSDEICVSIRTQHPEVRKNDLPPVCTASIKDDSNGSADERPVNASSGDSAAVSASAGLSSGERADCIQAVANDYSNSQTQTDLNGNLADTESLYPGCSALFGADAPQTDDIKQACEDIGNARLQMAKMLGHFLSTHDAPVCDTMRRQTTDAHQAKKDEYDAFMKSLPARLASGEFNCKNAPSNAQCARTKEKLVQERELFKLDSQEFWGMSDTPMLWNWIDCQGRNFASPEMHGALLASVTFGSTVDGGSPGFDEVSLVSSTGIPEVDAAAINFVKSCKVKWTGAGTTIKAAIPIPMDY
ncbi:hypothetical protein IHE49_12835 [Rhodanobacter sp. 7MK24]|uniref:hypothetical protein n=1 Tax=Rhodanobacter sp. 7MK24 TaxID=2775922 RepID=UPI0017828F0B|nr:hypothetical protein [Rhodanobacter sp. 7MK24]MBD8881370.1 hypothetical protein [Rhodanobacter sp. 7MK24]